MKRILIVEDDAALRLDLTQTIEDWGYEVRNASSGVNGSRLILEWEPHLVLCDINMPLMSGPDLRHKMLESHKEKSDIAFLFMSASAPVSTKGVGLDMAADGFVAKPINYNALRDKIQTQLIIYGSDRFGARKVVAGVGAFLGIMFVCLAFRMF